MKNKISILMANYNNGHYIREAIDSVLNQTYTNWELIIVDDCSTDDSLKILQPLLVDERIKVFVNEENRGCGYTKMRCAEESSGTYCGFLDPDDALVPHALSTMLEAFAKYPDSAMINSKDVFCDDQLNPVEVDPNSKDVSNLGSYLLYDGGGVTHFAVYRNDLYRKTAGISPEFTKAVDQDLYYLMDQEGTINFVDDVLYYYRIHTGGISTNKNVIPATYQHFKVMRKSAKSRLLDSRFRENSYAYKRLVARCDFHLSILDKKYITAIFRIVNYISKGGGGEVGQMFNRLFRHPKRVFNSLFNVYRVK
ncbi:glycosyltransferase [Sphingobacterium chungjuense]|uniref:glycosyltransferase n=1 Tax=Sphingobacterium chungjuense TaxID=2675553 RepID=UPI001408093C|nr:glycosyltransferase [Sphingobacterium chungjuense]